MSNTWQAQLDVTRSSIPERCFWRKRKLGCLLAIQSRYKGFFVSQNIDWLCVYKAQEMLWWLEAISNFFARHRPYSWHFRHIPKGTIHWILTYSWRVLVWSNKFYMSNSIEWCQSILMVSNFLWHRKYIQWKTTGQILRKNYQPDEKRKSDGQFHRCQYTLFYQAWRRKTIERFQKYT